MRWRWTTGVLATAAIITGVRANTPLPIYAFSWYGPLTVCTRGIALQVAAGEGYTNYGGAVLHLPGGGLSIDSFLSDPAADADIVQPRGTLAVPGWGEVARYQLTSRNSDWRGLGYVLDTKNRGSFPLILIQSAQFGGTDADAALLARVIGGEQAWAICAAAPPERQPRPERVDDAAFSFRPARVAGPLTLCWANLALDVHAGERGLLGWSAAPDVAGVQSGAVTMLLSGQAPGALVPGSLTTGGFVEAAQAGAFGYQFHTTPIARHARLARPADLAARSGLGVDAAFLGPVTPAEASALLGRVRARAPADTFFDPDRS